MYKEKDLHVNLETKIGKEPGVCVHVFGNRIGRNSRFQIVELQKSELLFKRTGIPKQFVNTPVLSDLGSRRLTIVKNRVSTVRRLHIGEN